MSSGESRWGSKGPWARIRVGKFVAARPDPVKTGIVEHIGRSDKGTICDLEPKTDDPGRTVKPGAVSIAQTDRHEPDRNGILASSLLPVPVW